MGRPLAILTALIVLLCAGAWWLLDLGGGAEAGPEAPGREAPSSDGAAGLEATAPDLEEPRAAGGGDDRRVAPEGVGPGDHPQWIEGHLSIPPGSPPDDGLEVLAFVPRRTPLDLPALQEESEPRWWRDVQRVTGLDPKRAEVDAAGRFRLALPGEAKSAMLLLDGRYLYLHRGRMIELPCGEPVILEPELGGCLLVRCVPPESAADGGAPLVGLELDLRGYDPQRAFSFGGLHRRTAIADSQHRAEFRAIPAHYDWFLLGDPPVYAASRDVGIGVEAGELLERDLPFALGADYSGRATDEAGAPVEGALVWIAPPDRRMGFGPGTRRETLTDARGAFRVAGARIGPVVVTAEKEGLCSARTETLVGRAGGATEGLELRLAFGASIAGRVLLPDGGLAAGARIELAPSAPVDEPAWAEARSWRVAAADARGAFRFTGLEEVPHDLFATAGAEPARLQARVGRVEAGSEDVELRLLETAALSGRVLGDDGEPVPAFRLELWPRSKPDQRIGGRHESAEGRFEEEGLFEGPWSLDVEARGWLAPEGGIAFEFPPAEGELEVVLTRSARLAGVVLDADGAPVEKGEVVLSGAGAEAERSPSTLEAVPVAETRTADDGSFAIEDVRPGVYELRADHARHAPSEKQVVEPAAGQTLDLTVWLPRGGTLTGEIYGADGAPDVGRRISAWSSLADDSASARSDAAGRFEIAPLAAGPYVVSAQPTREELERIQREGSDLVELSKIARRAEIEVVDGESVHVVLGSPPVDAIRVFGRVTEGGEPVDRGSVSLVPAGGGFSDRVDVTVEDDGSYELFAERDGDVVIIYQRQIYRTPAIDFPTRIPPGREHRFDIRLPAGSIEGLVIGSDGAPAPGVSITLTRDSGLARHTFYGPARGGRSGADGSFLVDGLEAGTFSLRVPGKTFRPDVSYAAAVVGGIAVEEGQRTGGIRIQLVESGTLTGRVLDAGGEPVPQAAVFAWDAEGRVLQPLTPAETDPTGRFRYQGLPEGELWVGARSPAGASAVRGPVRIRAGEETELELGLVASTSLLVLIEDQRGGALRARVHLYDSEGRDHAGLESIPAFTSGRVKVSPASEQRIGPVPAGSYRLEAISEHGQSQSRELELGATAEMEVRLRFEP